MRNPFKRLKDLKRYPSMAVGLLIISLFFIVAIYAVITLPVNKAIELWQARPGVWDEYPRNASPIWFDWLTADRLPRTIAVTRTLAEATMVEPLGEGVNRVEIALPFRYEYDGFPTELNLFTELAADDKIIMTVLWRTPDGRTITVHESRHVRAGMATYYISQDPEFMARYPGMLPHVVLFADPQDKQRALKGDYQMILRADLRQGDELAAKVVTYGQVQGLAGTDDRRRDLMVALLWGAPIAIAFGILAAIGAQVSTFVLAGIGTWYGGKLERTFQFLTQVNTVLPVLPILIMFGYFYSRSIWVMLGLVIALNVFSASLFTYRAMYLQAKVAPYFEAAQAYGAGNFRIIFRYLLPRLAPTLLPQFVMVIPTFVFLEATLAVLGLGDPFLPTWGKIIHDAYTEGALYKGYYYWIVQPAALLMLMGVGFALVGFSLDRIFNPRLRTV